MHITCITHNWKQDVAFSDCPAIELSTACASAGSETLKRLEEQLRPVNLSQNSIDQLRGLFLLLFGAILAVSYSEMRVDSMQLENAATFESPNKLFCYQQHETISSRYQPIFAAAKKQLLRKLIHHMADLAERTLVSKPSISKDSLLHQACDRWGSKGFRDWTIDPERLAPMTELPSSNQEVAKPQTPNNDFFASNPLPLGSLLSKECQPNTRSMETSFLDPNEDPFAGAMLGSPITSDAFFTSLSRPCDQDYTMPGESERVSKPYSGLTNVSGDRTTVLDQQMDNAQRIYDSIPTFESVNSIAMNAVRLLDYNPNMAVSISPLSLERRRQVNCCPSCTSKLGSSDFCDFCVQELIDFDGY